MNNSILGVVSALVASSIAFSASAQQRYQGDLCGNKVDVVLTTPDANANPTLKQFFGVWGDGKWSTTTCAGLIVSEINGDKAVVHYYYGAGPDAPHAGVYAPSDAGLKSGKWLLFHSSKGFEVSFELVGDQLKGWFGNNKTAENLKKRQ